jgi:capsular polysaccharide biosynthesis protein
MPPAPYVSPGVSARQHWRMILLIILVALLIATAAAFVRSPTYTAEARLIVGKTTQLDNLAATPGLSVAGQELAASYSRLMSTPSVQNDVARRLGGSLVGEVTATPIPQSPIIRVDGTAASGDRAKAVANAGARALIQAVDRVNTAQQALNDKLLQQYQTADTQLLRDTQTLQALQAQLAQASASASEGLRQQVLTAQTQVDTDNLRLRAIENDFQSAHTPGQLDQQVVQRLGAAGGATSDRDTFLEMALIGGLVAGILVGVLLSVALDRRAGSAASGSADGRSGGA